METSFGLDLKVDVIIITAIIIKHMLIDRNAPVIK
jgi:hypothetical protein